MSTSTNPFPTISRALSIYILITFFLSLFALTPARPWSSKTRLAITILIALFVGLRDSVGADWKRYLIYVPRYGSDSFLSVLFSLEPGYAVSNWISYQLGAHIYGVNLICALLFGYCLITFINRQPYPWVSLLVSFPYLITVVSMNYTGQSVAIGFELLALIAIEKKKHISSLIFIALASSFHISAILLVAFPLLLSINLAPKRLLSIRNVFGSLLLLLSSLLLYKIGLEQSMTVYTKIYLQDNIYHSSGAYIRLSIALIPSIIFLLNANKFNLGPFATRLYSLMSICVCLAAVLLFFSSSSTTLVDRVALYFFPIQLIVAGNLPSLNLFRLSSVVWRRIIALSSFSIIVVWLIFSSDSRAWIPYSNILFPFS